jgi:malonyl-CoA O-methyltransferase
MVRWPFAPKRGLVVERIDPQSAYSLWARNYPPRPHNALMAVEQQTVLSLLADVRDVTALDAGCGTGRYSRQLTLRGARAIGVDLSVAMLERARYDGARVARADFRALPFAPMSIDLVVCGLALGDVPDLELAIAEIARVLRPGGQLIYSVVHPTGKDAGWLRTFESEGRRLAIDGHWHSPDCHRRACAAAGLSIAAWREPTLPELPAQPAVLVVEARR